MFSVPLSHCIDGDIYIFIGYYTDSCLVLLNIFTRLAYFVESAERYKIQRRVKIYICVIHYLLYDLISCTSYNIYIYIYIKYTFCVFLP